MIPVLETERLILRESRLSDFPANLAMWTDPRTLSHFGGSARSEEDVWLRFQSNFGRWHLSGFGYWAVEDKASGAYAGGVGFFEARRPLLLPYRDRPEAGWIIAPDFHGRGFAHEAVARIVAWADENLDAPETWCMIAPGNLVSQKVAAGAGYRPAQDALYKEQPVLTFTRARLT